MTVQAVVQTIDCDDGEPTGILRLQTFLEVQNCCWGLVKECRRLPVLLFFFGHPISSPGGESGIACMDVFCILFSEVSIVYPY